MLYLVGPFYILLSQNLLYSAYCSEACVVTWTGMTSINCPIPGEASGLCGGRLISMVTVGIDSWWASNGIFFGNLPFLFTNHLKVYVFFCPFADANLTKKRIEMSTWRFLDKELSRAVGAPSWEKVPQCPTCPQVWGRNRLSHVRSYLMIAAWGPEKDRGIAVRTMSGTYVETGTSCGRKTYEKEGNQDRPQSILTI